MTDDRESLTTYVVLLRGINVGGKNKIAMAELKRFLEGLGFRNVLTYIQSGNVILQSAEDAQTIAQRIELRLPDSFALDSVRVRVLVLTYAQLARVIDQKPAGFGEQHEKYHSDAIFLIGIEADQAMTVFAPCAGVDSIWAGDGVIYSQRLSERIASSRLNRIIGTPAYQAMTIRNWNTTTKLLELMRPLENQRGRA
jgi:uncharacterized protein (DUF1697 family)